MRQQHFASVLEATREIYDFQAIAATLSWDQQTMMPPKGNDARTRQLSLLATLIHARLSDRKFGSLLEECLADPSLSSEQYALIREMKRDRDRAVNVPAGLVTALADATGRALPVWSAARGASDFKSFAPHLERILELKKEESRAIGASSGILYDAQLDRHEPGATVRNLDPVLTRTRDITITVLRALSGAKRKSKENILTRAYPEEAQQAFAHQALERMGYDFEAGRLDRSAHPFSTGLDPDDVRITTRYEENWFPAAFFGAVHEGGHALYEQGLGRAFSRTPLGEACSTGIHESQSRLWENQIARSRAFWKYFFPRARKCFSKALGTTSLDDFYSAINNVRPSLIRVEADEVTYNLHIIVRYELEKALFAGDLSVSDLPGAWNDKYEAYLGIRPKKDSEGVLQDIHWALGMTGYFPTYLLGNLYSAQWMNAMRRDLPRLDADIAKGNLMPVKAWLQQKIYVHGRRYSSTELARRVTGEEINPEHFGSYLREKYASLYGVTWMP